MEEKHMAIAFVGGCAKIVPDIDKYESDQFFALQKRIWQEVHRYIKDGYSTFYCGAARGADILWGEIILAEKETNCPELKLICVIPFKKQTRGWGIIEKMRYRELMLRSDRIVQLYDSYQRGCYRARNHYMIDNSDVLIAIYNGEPKDGTACTVEYAKRQGKEIVIINPDTLTKAILNAQD